LTNWAPLTAEAPQELQGLSDGPGFNAEKANARHPWQ